MTSALNNGQRFKHQVISFRTSLVRSGSTVVSGVIYDSAGPCGNAAHSVFSVCLDCIDWCSDEEQQSGTFVKAGCHC